MVNRIKLDRYSINCIYTQANDTIRQQIIKQTRKYLLTMIRDSLIPYWYGTPWDFYGTTRIPRQGKIACGYFVTTILNDVGFRVPIKWAQLASEEMILKFSPYKVKRFKNQPLADVENYLLKQGEGLYLTGLDCHVGFLYVQNNSVSFIHSNYYFPDTGVMSESITTNNPFRYSKYRVISKLFSDPMVDNWIRSESYK